VGIDAELSEHDAQRLISHIKPLLGKESIEDVYLSEFMQLTIKKQHINVACEDSEGREKLYTPEELSAIVLLTLRHYAMDYINRKPYALQLKTGEDIELHKVVLGVPAHCTEKFKDALRYAANIAGFDEAS
jgi:molecular chaperone DnaK (HSP70)